MVGVTSITMEQLRAAVKAWEVDVRDDRAAFASDEEARTLPLDEQVDGIVSKILGYVQAAGGDGSPVEG